MEYLWQAADSEATRPSTSPKGRALRQALIQQPSLGDEVESFWRDPAHRRAGRWSEHRDINEVILATSLAPEGFLIKSTLTRMALS